MAFPTTYAGWISYIKSWLDVEDLSDTVIGQAFDLAQQRLNDDLNSMWIEAGGVVGTWSSNLAAFSIIGNIPDFNRIITVSTDATGQPLIPASFNEYLAYTSTGNNSNVLEVPSEGYDGLPQFYSVNAGGIYIWPTPVDTSVISVRYYKTVPLLVSGGVLDSNEFTRYHPNLLFMAALKEASQYIVEDERTPMWEASYQMLLDKANRNAKAAKFGQNLKREVPNLGMPW